MKLNKVFFCVIYGDVYDKNKTATLPLCSKALDEIAKGKKIRYLFGCGILSKSHYEQRYVQITHIYADNSGSTYTDGMEIGLHKFWLEVGKVARIKLLTMNPSRRKIFKGD
jgi:hypothetical protein